MRPAFSAAIALCLASLTMPAPLRAESFQPVTDRDAFVALVSDRSLSIPLWRISLDVLSDGRIEGEAMGAEVTGRWTWANGYFCREMDWSGQPIDHDCQLVEADGSGAMRFTVDRGKGRSAIFRIE